MMPSWRRRGTRRVDAQNDEMLADGMMAAFASSAINHRDFGQYLSDLHLSLGNIPQPEM